MMVLDRLAWLANVALGLAVLGCGGGSGPKLTPEQEIAATAMCKKAASCDGVSSPTSSDMNRCKEEIAGALQIFPDPDAFAACVNGLTCDEVENDEAILTCVDWNYSTLKCSATTSGQLDGCNNAGKCAAVSCVDVCELMGDTYDSCAHDAGRGWDVCWCRE